MFEKFEPQFVNVPSLAQNCFFYCLALHYLANYIDLPEELFQDYPGDSDSYLQLKALIREDGLNFFEKYVDEKYKPLDFVFEKNIVLGFLFRSLYVHKLRNNKDMKENIISGNQGHSLVKIAERTTSLNSCRARLNKIIDSEDYKELYKDNESYFIALKDDPNFTLSEVAEKYKEGAFKQKLDGLINLYKAVFLQISELESYHQEDKTSPLYNANKDFYEGLLTEMPTGNIWDDKFIKYCNYLLQETQISKQEISFFLADLGIDFGFWGEESAVSLPSFILKLDVTAGHYLLLKRNESPIFENYEKQLKEYKTQSITDLLFRSVTTDDSTVTVAKDGTINAKAATPPLDRLFNCLKSIKESYTKKQIESQNQATLLIKNALDNLKVVAERNLDSKKAKDLIKEASEYINSIRTEAGDLASTTKGFLEKATAIYKIENKAGKVVAAVALAVTAFVLTAALFTTLCFLTGGLAGFWAISIAAVGLVLKSGAAVGAIAAISSGVAAIVGAASGAGLAGKLGFFENNRVDSAVTKVAEAGKAALAAG